MKPVLLLAAMLAAGIASAKDPKAVSIYVGPMVRDGFVDVDQGVRDSIADLTGELRKSGAFTVVANESAAALRLYVVTRAKVATGGGVTVGTATGTSSGTFAQGVTIPVEVMRLETLLRVGSYERAFTGQSETAWRRCAGPIVKDLGVWLTANRERIP